MATAKTLVRNLSSSWAGHFVYALTSLILTPVVLSSLGTTQFGLWSLVTGLTGYYGLLDLGFRSSLNRFIAKYRALSDWENLNRFASTGTAVLCLCGLVLWCATWVMTYLAPSVFPVSSEDATPLRWAVFFMGTSLSLQFPFFLQSSVFVATQRFDLANLIGITGRVIQTLTVIAVVRNGGGLAGMSAAVALTELATYAARYCIAAKLIPELRVSPRYVGSSTLKQFANYSVWAMLSGLSSQLIGTSDRYVVAFLLGTSSVTRFQLAFTIVAQMRQVFSPFARVFFPALVEVEETGRKERFTALYLAGTQTVALLVIPVAIIGAVWGPDFFRLWIGAAATGDGMADAATILRILLVGTVARVPQAVGYQVFHAKFQLPSLTAIMLTEAVSNIALSLILCHRFGLIGVAAATAITSVGFEVFLFPRMIASQVGMPAHRIVMVTWLRPVLVGVALLPVILGLRALGPIESWLMLVSVGVVAGSAALALILLLGLTKEQRDRYVWPALLRREDNTEKVTP